MPLTTPLGFEITGIMALKMTASIEQSHSGSRIMADNSRISPQALTITLLEIIYTAWSRSIAQSLLQAPLPAVALL